MLATLTLPAPCQLDTAPRAARLQVRSADELRQALRQSRDQPLTVDGSTLDRVLRLDAARGLVEVQAAASWSGLAAYLKEPPLDAFATAGLPGAIGEAISQNSAGPDGLPVAAHVAALTLVTHDGELRRCDRETNRELFALVLGGHGLFGVLYSATLRIESLLASARGAEPPATLQLAPAPGAQLQASELECLVPPEQLEAFLAEVRAFGDEERACLHEITVRRYRPQEDGVLRWATREWAGVRLHFSVRRTLGSAVRAAEIRRGLLGIALARDGSFPVSDTRDATRAQLEACYPALAGFLAEKRRCDPGERLRNGWLRGLRATLRRESFEVRWSA